MTTYDPAFFEELFAIEDKHFWFRARNRVLAALVSQLEAGWAPGYRVLEVGCGTGNVLRLFKAICARGQVIGLDMFTEGLRFAQQRKAGTLVQGDGRAAPFGECFNLIGLFDVMEHLPDDVQMLEELWRLLNPSGVLLLTVPAYSALWSYFDEAAHHSRRYEMKELERKLTNAGYRVDYLTTYMGTILPMVWARRWLASHWPRTNGQLGDESTFAYQLTQSEFKVLPIFNEIMAGLLAPEVYAVRNHWRLPLGASLLAIATKPSVVI
jgi:SAM-dependent methyltransferase